MARNTASKPCWSMTAARSSTRRFSSMRMPRASMRATSASRTSRGRRYFGIPKYRLPREVLDAEVARIEALGIRIELNRRVDDLAAVMDQHGFDAVFLAIGAHLARRASIPAMDARRILDAVSVLRGM